MKSFLLLLLLQFISTVLSSDRRRLTGYKALDRCHQFSCSPNLYMFNCMCEDDAWWETRNDRIPYGPAMCIRATSMCDGTKDCPDGSDELDCTCGKYEHQCSKCKIGGGCDGLVKQNLYQCLSITKIELGNETCWNRSKPKVLSHGRRCFPFNYCDGKINCPWLTPNDEENCESRCPHYRPLPCACNKKNDMQCQGEGDVCYDKRTRCNGYINCIDGSDEVGCKCKEDEFECMCHKKDPLTCVRNGRFTGCIKKSWMNDGIENCVDGSDERHFRAKLICEGKSRVTIRRWTNVSECTNIGCTRCDNSTCIEVLSLNCNSSSCNETNVICSSCSFETVNEECRRGLQCADGTLIATSQFCDGSVDCSDRSDEIRNRPGFKCTNSLTACVLPQQNLFDDYPHCLDKSDLCMQNNSCFQCLDRSIYISPKQVCNGVFDCPDYSDECLCQEYLKDPACNVTDPEALSLNLNCPTTHGTGTSSRGDGFSGRGRASNLLRIWSNDFNTKLCVTKKGEALVTLCDGRPECRDLSDECESGCADLPSFCNDSCHSFYPLGDRYCDGYIDEAWMYINSSKCPRGFDERNCPRRFYCEVGDKINIEISKVCDGVPDCDDLSDEKNCVRSLFSSETEMIANHVIKSSLWIIGFVVVAGNLYVIISTILLLKNTRSSDYLRCQRVILLNVAIADLIMGIYLMIIAIYSVVYSGFYGQVDHRWRTSLNCSVLGSLVVLSSEASCLLIVLLTAFRLYSIWSPVSSLTVSRIKWNVAVAFPWLIAVLLAIVPLLSSNYFVYDILLENEFSKTGVWKKCEIEIFANRLAEMTNASIEFQDNQWDAATSYLHDNFPQYHPQGEFGYYSETSICMPRFYVVKGVYGWEYSLAIVTMNFLAFVFIAVSYVVIYWISTNRQLGKKTTTDKQESTMQKRIARIIFTDFACWLPICVMAYARLSGVFLEPIVYQISAVLLLPINSALNPILYSSLLDKIGGVVDQMKKRKDMSSFPQRKLPVKTSTTKASKPSAAKQ